MNDETADVAEKESGPIGGERLRAARRDNDISVGDIAKELHLDEYKVRALERNEFDVLGAPVFAKGHLRKYAELVGVPVDDIMSDYYRMNRSVGAPPVVGPKRKRSSSVSFGRWLGAAVIVILIVAGAYWWFTRAPVQAVSDIVPATLAPFQTNNNATPSEAEEPSAGEILPDEDPDAGQDVTSTPVDRPAAAVPAQAATPEPAAQQSEPLEESVPRVSLDLAYSGDCWTEVSDASGQRLYYDLGRAGTVITVAGAAPLRVILGDAANVSLSVAGRDYPIPASARNGRLARLDINRP